MQQHDLTGWLFDQLNNHTQRFIKDDIVLILIIYVTERGEIDIVVDIHQDNEFLTSRNSLKDALKFVEDM